MAEEREEMHAEFDTVAVWTADAARALGTDHHLPAACRGSGRPAALDWLLARLDLAPGDRLLDIGAGVGGPAEYARRRAGAAPVLFEPAAGAARAARSLFGLPVVRADALALPLPDGAATAVWTLGVLCTVPDHDALLGEIARVLRPGGRCGLLVFVARRDRLPEQPEGNTFPGEARLTRELAAAGLQVIDRIPESATTAEPPSWERQVADVAAELARRHGDDPAWQADQRQAEIISRLLACGDVSGELLVVQR